MMKLFLSICIFFGANLMAFEISEKGTCQIEGVTYPAMGYGTYPYKDQICYNAVLHAGKSGYRIIDTATFYGNFGPIGKALKKMGREKFYLISKVWPDSQTAEGIRKDIEKTLKQLQTPYIDAYLVHWPNNKIPIEETLNTMESLRKEGLIRHIGLSNVTVNHLKRALELNIPIAWVQVEMNPSFYDPELLKYCQDHSITVQAWGPLGRGRLSEDKLLKRIGEKHGKTASQVALKWTVQHHCLPLPGSKNQEHISQNFKSLDFTLSKEEMAEIDSQAKKGKRERVTPERNLGFSDEFDFSYEECWPVR